MLMLLLLCFLGAFFMTYALITIGVVCEIQSNIERLKRDIKQIENENGWEQK